MTVATDLTTLRSLAVTNQTALLAAIDKTILDAAVVTPPPPPPPSTDITGALGFYPGYGNPTWYTNLETWLGRKGKWIVQMGDTSSANNFMSSVWGEVTNPGAIQTLGSRVNIVLSVPLAFGPRTDVAGVAAQLAATNAGLNDAGFSYAAQSLKNAGFLNAVLRIGWEGDGIPGWMPWAEVGNEPAYIKAFQRVVFIFRSVLPNCKIDYCGDPGMQAEYEKGYPGDAYVDICGLDVYDQGTGAAWNSATQQWKDPVASFAVTKASLDQHLTFALAHGKSVSFPEWALTGNLPNESGGDNPTFIQGMHDHFVSIPSGKLAYQSYFNEDTNGNHRINASFFPNASNRYKLLFG